MANRYFLELKNIEGINWNLPWLVLGKGPTFQKLYDDESIKADYLYGKYNVFGLNHVCSQVQCHLTNIIDLEVFSQIERKCLLNNNLVGVITPFHPHLNSKVSKVNIYKWQRENWTIQKLNIRQKLFFYNLSTWKGKHHPEYFSPVVRAKYFSAEAVIHLLCLLGVQEIYTLGIDGGNKYADVFGHLKPLSNGRKDFDDQFKEINRTVAKFGVKYGRL